MDGNTRAAMERAAGDLAVLAVRLDGLVSRVSPTGAQSAALRAAGRDVRSAQETVEGLLRGL